MNRLKMLLSAALITMLMMCTAMPVATASSGENIYVNNVPLSSTTAYWKNGDTAAAGTSTGDWNAYYSEAAGMLTLKLRNATVDTLTNLWEDVRVFDLRNLEHDSGFGGCKHPDLYNRNAEPVIRAVRGRKSFDSGNRQPDFDTWQYGSEYGNRDKLRGWIFHVGRKPVAQCIKQYDGIRDSGGWRHQRKRGTMAIQAAGEYGAAIEAEYPYNFTLSGGTMNASLRVTAIDRNAVISANNVVLSDGDGNFAATGTGTASGAAFLNKIEYNAGKAVFSAQTQALMDMGGIAVPVVNNAGTPVYVATSATGAGKTEWDTVSRLAYYSGDPSTRYLYVEFGGVPSAPTVAAAPQTGDASTPWLWAGLALVALGAATALCTMRATASKT